MAAGELVDTVLPLIIMLEKSMPLVVVKLMFTNMLSYENL